ncbi:MAG: molecular chaperone TorD family protein [Deltaproteobacteria bacterium]|nr:molecular chaperone TorD family protein [Deltaproteobacteria bacterium]
MNNCRLNEEEQRAWVELLDFAADLYLNEPNPECLVGCRAAGRLLDGIFPEESFPEMFAAAETGPAAEILQEYFDLFFVPVSGRYLAPFEAAHREKYLAPELPVLIGRLYAETGFAPARLDIPSYMQSLNRPDHIGFEMAFLARLLDSSLILAADGDLPQARILLETAISFHSRYPGRWAVPFGRRLEETAGSHLYRGLGSLTQFINREFAATYLQT